VTEPTFDDETGTTTAIAPVEFSDTGTSLLPEGETWATDGEGDDEDFGEIRVNFSKEEAESTSFDDLPAGKYIVAITDGKVKKCGPGAKNPGKPYYNLEYTVQPENKTHVGRKLFDNVMLFSPALYSLSNLMKALGVDINQGDFVVPKIPDLLGQKFMARVRIQPAREVDGKTYDARPEVKGYFPLNSAKALSSNADPLAP